MLCAHVALLECVRTHTRPGCCWHALPQAYPNAFIEKTLAASKARETASDEDVAKYGVTASTLETFYTRDRLAEEQQDTLGVTDFKPASRTTDAGVCVFLKPGVWGRGWGREGRGRVGELLLPGQGRAAQGAAIPPALLWEQRAYAVDPLPHHRPYAVHSRIPPLQTN